MEPLRQSTVDYSEVENRAGVCSTSESSTSHNVAPKSQESRRAIDVEFVLKILHRERILRELDSYWDYPFERSDSVGIRPDATHAPLKRKAVFGDENRPPKRAKVKTVDGAHSFPSHAFINFSVAGPSTQPTPAPPMSAKALGKQRAVEVSNDEPVQDTPIPPTDVGEDAKPPTTAPGAALEPDLEDKKEDDDYVRCRWNGCTKMIARAAYKAHLDAGHAGQLTAARRSYRCTWEGCTSESDTHPTMERHLRTVHYEGKIHVCERCGAAFNRKDALRRHKNQSSRCKVKIAK
ncbi:hypothetical protein C8Q78DRAFT_1083007 [Trametes maxima]|nr:hypothetical protein C8Q78DRAFT_1083007 [Trametes maxima]